MANHQMGSELSGETSHSVPSIQSGSAIPESDSSQHEQSAVKACTVDFYNQSLLLQALCYNSCIDKNEPAPVVVATQKAKKLLSEISQLGPQEKSKIGASMISATILPLKQVGTSSAADIDRTIRSIQVQVLLRIQFWSILGKLFVRLYNEEKSVQPQSSKRKGSRLEKKRTKKKQKSQDSSRNLLNDIIDLLSMAAMRLPESRSFSSFLQDCLATRITNQPNCLLPRGLYQQLYENFEVNNPENPAEQEYVPISLVSESDQPRKATGTRVMAMETKKPTTNNYSDGAVKLEPSVLTESVPAKDKPKDSNGNSKNNGKNDSNQPKTKSSSGDKSSLFSQGVNLVAPVIKKRNSILSSAGGRSQYVGSHFTSKHSNMNTLFREVKTQRAEQATSHSFSSRGRGVVNSKAGSQASKPPQGATKQTSMKKSQTTTDKRKQSQCFHVAADGTNPTKKKKFVQETPLKRGRNKRTKHLTAREVVFAASNALKRHK